MTATLSSPGSPPPLVRIRRAPAFEPPTDDDRRPDDHPVCAGQLALFTSVHGIRARDGAPAGRAGTSASAGSTRSTGTAGASSSASAPAYIAASRFVSACVEVLNGFRPAAHLRALTTPLEFTGVTTQLTRRAVRLRMPGRDPAGRERVGVHRLRVFEQRAGVAEAVAVLGNGEASWAMALRFENRRGSWLCTLLEVV
ncbi:MAG TPA: Rv3235 family protein [Planosporangium sp.]|nr:Rv3235 family protein [Planosporangium sp.]